MKICKYCNLEKPIESFEICRVIGEKKNTIAKNVKIVSELLGLKDVKIFGNGWTDTKKV